MYHISSDYINFNLIYLAIEVPFTKDGNLIACKHTIHFLEFIILIQCCMFGLVVTCILSSLKNNVCLLFLHEITHALDNTCRAFTFICSFIFTQICALFLEGVLSLSYNIKDSWQKTFNFVFLFSMLFQTSVNIKTQFLTELWLF